MSNEPALMLAVVVVALTAACNPKGTCVIDEGVVTYKNAGAYDTGRCLVDYPKSACSKPGVYEAVTGAAGVASCRGRGFTVAKTRDNDTMPQSSVDAALKRGESVTFRRPSKFDRR